ncbi:MAG: PaaI family thioesterase, partial [Ignavibacteriales bacterium]
AAGNHPMMDSHFFNCCFVCGPGRKPADGLRIFAGIVEDQDYVAADWIPDLCFADDSGLVRNEIVWAALDCPGAWAALTDRLRPIVLGRIAVEIINPVKAGQKLVVIGWKIAEEGRKIQVGTALFDEDSRLLAKARAIWIELK